VYDSNKIKSVKYYFYDVFVKTLLFWRKYKSDIKAENKNKTKLKELSFV